MKKLILAILIIAPIFIIAQNIKKEKVKTSFLSYPKIDVTNIDLSTLQFDFCAGEIKNLGQTTKKTTTACKPKGGSIKDAKALEVFYYQFSVMNPISYLKISNSSGEIKLIEEVTKEEKSIVEYGKNKCYFLEAILKSAFNKDKTSFQSKSQKKWEKSALKSAEDHATSALFFSYIPQQIQVMYVKDKKQDYSDLEKASTLAVEGYKGLKDHADNKGAQAKLTQAIAIWEKALTESTPDLKDSRINKKVTLAISENVGRADMYLMEFDKAAKIIKDALALEKNFSTNGTQNREALLAAIKEYKKGYEMNKSTSVNMNVTKVTIKQHPNSEIGSFTEVYKKHGRAEMAEEIAESKEEYNKAVESGEINPYQRYVMAITGGNQLTLPDLTAKLTKAPGGEKLEVFPEEITNLSEVTHLILRGNNLKTIPPSIGKMTKLKKLVLTNNQLTTLPDEIGKLKELKNLVLKGNKISSKEISRIQALLPNCKIKL